MNYTKEKLANQDISENIEILKNYDSEVKYPTLVKIYIAFSSLVNCKLGIFPSHQCIAEKSGLKSRRTVLRALKIFDKAGIISWRYRYKRTSIYTIHKKLIFCVPLTLIMSAMWIDSSRAHKEDDVTLSLLKEFNNGVNGKSQNSIRSHFTTYETIPPEKIKKIGRRRLPVSIEQRLVCIKVINQHLPLTEHGIINLKKYPVEALRSAISKINWALPRENPYISLLAVCEKYCRDKGLFVERLMYDRERYEKGISKQDQEFYKKDLFVRPGLAPKKRPAQTQLPPVVQEDREDTVKKIMAMDTTNIFLGILQKGFSGNNRNKIV